MRDPVRTLIPLSMAAALLAGCDTRHYLGNVVTPSSDAGNLLDAGTSLNVNHGPLDAAPPHMDAGGRELGPLGASQSWSGYVENPYTAYWALGLDTFKIVFAKDAAGSVAGTVTFGTGAPPPPPTDPNVGYPPGLDFEPGPASQYMAQGFPYTIADGTLVGGRLRLTVQTGDLWTAWCAIETPVDGSGTCLPNWQGMSDAAGTMCAQLNPATNQYVPVDCGKFELCFFSRICACDTTSCAVDLSYGNRVTFDVILTDTDGSGSIAGLLMDRNVHLTRDP